MNCLKNIVLTASLLSSVLLSCKQEMPGPLSDDGAAPDPVSNVQVENLSGAAKIMYALPGNSNLLYVKAEYESNGVKRDAKSSFYNNSLIVDGFGDTNEHTVTLYAVSYGEKISNPVSVKIKPLTPPIQVARNSLKVVAAFGGINVAYENPDKGNLILQILRKGADQLWSLADTYYTKSLGGNFYVRGQQSIETEFGVVVKDRWDNRTDTLKIKLTPIFEQELDKAKFKEGVNGILFPTEPAAFSSGWVLKNLWDNSLTKGYQTIEKIALPLWVTFDLGVKAKLSRYKIWQRSGYYFNHGAPLNWELWGSNNPDADGGWNNWVKLDDYQMTKPSGLPLGQLSDEDNAVALAGQEYDVPIIAPAVRYLRWKHIDSWSTPGGTLGFLGFQEISIFGKVE